MNPLSRERLEAARLYMNRFDPFPIGHDEADTVRAAIKFLLNPEPTDEMVRAAMDRGAHFGVGASFKAMIQSLTAETP